MSANAHLLRVGFLKQEFIPDQAVASRQIVEGLRAQGAHVRVITGTATTVEGRRAPDAPRLGVRREWWDGVETLRLPFWPSHDRSAARRMGTYASFSASSSVAAAWAFRDLDVVLVYGSPATAAAAPMLWTRTLRLPYVLHVQDLWPDSVFATGFLNEGVISTASERALSKYMRLVYQRAAAIVAISPGMRDAIIDRGVPAGKVHAIYNWTDENQFMPCEPREHPDPVLMYAGTIGFAQDLDTLLNALKLTRTQRLRVVIVGTGPAERHLRDRVTAEGLTNVTFVGRLTPDETREQMRRADVHLVTLVDEPLFRITVPSKVQSLLASGVPMIAAVPGEAGALVEHAGAGLSCRPEDPASLATAIDNFFSLPKEDRLLMGARGNAYYTEHLSASLGSARLARVLQSSSGGSQLWKP